MELLNSVVTSLIPTVAGAVTKHVAYPFKVGNNISDLESAVQTLVALKEDLMTSIRNAEREHGIPTESAKDWLIQVEKIETEAEHIMTDYRQRSRCLWNHSADIWSNYKISKRAAEKQAEVKSLCDKKTNLKDTISVPPPLAQEMPASSSESPNLQLALHHINDDVHNIIGIWGKGGIGKTHLLNQINNELCKDRALFRVVIFVTCSQDCSEEKVHDVIINKLGLNKNPELKQSTIYNFFKDRSFVLLLDDLWSRVDLDKVGIPNPISTIGACKRKIILTTRLKDVCRDMDVKKFIKVDALNSNQAWSLFVDKVTEETVMSHPLIQQYAVNVMEELGGLPLALIIVGRAMCDKRNINDWEKALQLLKRARLHDVANESVFHTLSFSYDYLRNDTLKECFLHCSLWPEDHCIKMDELVELWMGVGLIDEPEIQLAYNVGYTYIGNLQDVCLLEEGEGSDGELGVKLHDVIRDLALWIANDRQSRKNKWIVQAGTREKPTDTNVSSETEKLSLMLNFSGEFSLPCASGSPKLSILLLKSNSLYKFPGLQQFLGLTVLDMSRNSINDFFVEICKLVNLQFLNLSNNDIRSLPEELAALTNLRYLLLGGNEIGSIPYGILSKLNALRVLDICPLSNFYLKRQNSSSREQIKLVSPVLEEIKSLANFQALGAVVTNMHEFQKLNENLNVHVRWLQVAITSDGRNPFTFSDSFLENPQMQNNLLSLLIQTSGEYLNFKSTPGSACHLGRLERLSFSQMYAKDILWENLNPKDVFSRLQTLEFHRCNHLTSISWVLYLPCLQELHVTQCSGIKQLISEEYVVNSGEIDARYPTFPFLKKMVLIDLYKLESICDPKITFLALETMKIAQCHMLSKLPFKADNIPPKLWLIRGGKEWWANIENKFCFLQFCFLEY